MTDAPERIWATEDADYCTKWATQRSNVGYIRADRVAEPVEALRTLLIAADADSYADYFNAIEAGHAVLAKWDAK